MRSSGGDWSLLLEVEYQEQTFRMESLLERPALSLYLYAWNGAGTRFGMNRDLANPAQAVVTYLR